VKKQHATPATEPVSILLSRSGNMMKNNIIKETYS